MNYAELGHAGCKNTVIVVYQQASICDQMDRVYIGFHLSRATA